MNTHQQICNRCIMDTTVPDIWFDDKGECNYCKLHDALHASYPQGDEGKKILNKLFEEIKKKGKGNDYDLVVGVSGGVDSTYLTHMAIEAGLRPLAVNLDNGWHSEIAVSNIKNSIEKLGVDLETYVVEYEEMKDILLSYMKAGMAWADCPTDIAIVSTLYRIAAKHNIKYVFVGNNFRTEGKQPDEWTHSDGKQLKYIQKKFGKLPIKTFPNLTISNLLYFSFFRGIKMIRPFYYIDYDKSKAKELMSQKYDWRDYGGHHHESVFTRFIIGYWLPRKFNIDKRKVTYSAQIRSKQITREYALNQVNQPPYDLAKMEEDKELLCKKLGISMEEFQVLIDAPNKSFRNYPSYYPLYLKTKKIARFVFNYLLPFKPMMMFEIENPNKK